MCVFYVKGTRPYVPLRMRTVLPNESCATKSNQSDCSNIWDKRAALVRPSVPFWQWLVADSGAGGGAGAGDGGAAGGGSARTWQMRGGIKLSALELALLTGPRFSAAICEGKVRYKASSIWAARSRDRIGQIAHHSSLRLVRFHFFLCSLPRRPPIASSAPLVPPLFTAERHHEVQRHPFDCRRGRGVLYH